MSVVALPDTLLQARMRRVLQDIIKLKEIAPSEPPSALPFALTTTVGGNHGITVGLRPFLLPFHHIDDLMKQVESSLSCWTALFAPGAGA
jgi:hypothetical protein